MKKCSVISPTRRNIRDVCGVPSHTTWAVAYLRWVAAMELVAVTHTRTDWRDKDPAVDRDMCKDKPDMHAKLRLRMAVRQHELDQHNMPHLGGWYKPDGTPFGDLCADNF